MFQSETDFSDGYNQVRAQINAETGDAYSRFVKGLRPHYARVWRDMALGFAALLLSLALATLPSGLPARLIAAVLCAPLAGYAIAYLHLFIHEAAHYNLARDRSRNDFLCDLLISWQVGTRVADYRPNHFAHHRNLGRPNDTERSYFNALTPRFVFEVLSGIHALRVLLARRKDAATRADDAPENSKPKRDLAPPLRGLAVYLLIAALLFALGAWPAILTLGLGLVIFFPFFATLRQLLEHRAEGADPAADYGAVPHGAVTRNFGDGPLASTLGGVGFNRHLLHHWEPQVSYTRLKDLETFVISTQAGAILDRRRTTYLKAARSLLRNDMRPRTT